MHHPWRAFRDLTRWTLVWVDTLDDDAIGITCWHTRTVTMLRGLLYAERRCTIEHERQHILRGPVADEPVLVAREEAAVERAAARALIAIHDLGEALAWSHSFDEVADELAVDRATLDVRIAHLHPSERHYLRRRLADVE